MKTEIRSLKQIERDLHGDYPELTQYERLNIAVQIERNEILENGLGVSSNDSYPPGLVAIAIALGFGDEPNENSINQTLKELVDQNRS